ncbi:hypothetical protein JL722_4202 [Aureococcus anophagefferens]|nr:hypothetical protein JL722_4202 [Aureococcus anophagefferens]
MEQGSNLSKEQLLAYIKKQKKAIAALTEDKAAKQVIIEDLKNEFASLEPKLRNRVAQLQEENDALRSADAPADAPRPTPPRGSRPPRPPRRAAGSAPRPPAPTRRRVVELGRARDAALAEAEAARRAALDADARAVRCDAAAGELEADKALARRVGELERYVASVESKAKKRAEDAVAAAARDRDGALDDRDAAPRCRDAKTHKAVADALEAAKAGAKAALETMRVYSSAVATLERHLKRERDLRTSEDASDNVLFLKNSVVRFLCAKDDKEMQDMLGAMASILSLAPHEVEAIEAAAAKPGLVPAVTGG